MNTLMTEQACVDTWRSQIEALDLGAFSVPDLVNLILQRSKVLFDRENAGSAIKAWSRGDADPLLKIVDEMGSEIAVRTGAIIRQEFEDLRPALDSIAPKSIADIGAGYGFFDLFAAQHLDAKCILIDIESNEDRHFGFQEKGAAYSNLSVSKTLFTANGLEVETINPEQADLFQIEDLDLAVSFLSCGFHYPLSTYHRFFQEKVKKAVIVDVRARQLQQELDTMADIGEHETLTQSKKYRRLLFRRDAA